MGGGRIIHQDLSLSPHVLPNCAREEGGEGWGRDGGVPAHGEGDKGMETCMYMQVYVPCGQHLSMVSGECISPVRIDIQCNQSPLYAHREESPKSSPSNVNLHRRIHSGEG